MPLPRQGQWRRAAAYPRSDRLTFGVLGAPPWGLRPRPDHALPPPQEGTARSNCSVRGIGIAGTTTPLWWKRSCRARLEWVGPAVGFPARRSSPMPYGSSSASGDVGVARTGSRITLAMRPSAARGETSGPRPKGRSPLAQIQRAPAPPFAAKQVRGTAAHDARAGDEATTACASGEREVRGDARPATRFHLPRHSDASHRGAVSKLMRARYAAGGDRVRVRRRSAGRCRAVARPRGGLRSPPVCRV
jgi:hypothetical protein